MHETALIQTWLLWNLKSSFIFFPLRKSVKVEDLASAKPILISSCWNVSGSLVSCKREWPWALGGGYLNVSRTRKKSFQEAALRQTVWQVWDFTVLSGSSWEKWEWAEPPLALTQAFSREGHMNFIKKSWRPIMNHFNVAFIQLAIC